MKITLLLADTGRITPAGMSALQIGWRTTWALPQPEGDFGLPDQAVLGFIEADFGEIRAYPCVLRLIHEDGESAQIRMIDGNTSAEVRLQLLVQQPQGSPPGSAGYAGFLMNFPQGTIRIKRAPGLYKWTAAVGEHHTGEASFWVNMLPMPPQFGPPPATS